MRQKLLDGLAEVLETPTVTEDTVLAEAGNWDSLAVVCTIALLDEKAGVEVDGQALAACVTAGDVLRLAGAREQQTIASDEVGDLGSVLSL
jgi:acyl carrier protein